MRTAVTSIFLFVLFVCPAGVWAEDYKPGIEIIHQYRNTDGSYDTYNLSRGEHTFGFRNPDGSQDTYNTTTGEHTFGFR
ncbi:MAG TPA: hypothetical protein PLY90_10275, partial [Candidatus Hydrogenedentes bacterium]|nr:hypothetical protein [Candidatus Hydrogenedentota bacterium]